MGSLERPHVVVAVWGEAYTRRFLDLSLAAQLAAGNLPAFSHTGAVYRIFTTSDSERTLREHPCFKALSACMPVDLVSIDDIDLTDKYLAARVIQARQILDAARTDSPLIFLPPDTVYSDGTFARLAECLRAGKRGVAVHELRVEVEGMSADLNQFRNYAGRADLTVSPRALASVAFRHLHPQTLALVAARNTPSVAPGHLYWRVGVDAALVRSFHLHPLMVWPRRVGVLPSGAIDFDFTQRACPNLRDTHVVRRSDEILACQLSPRDQFAIEHDLPPAPGRAATIALWSGLMTTRHHRAFFSRPITIRGTPDPGMWWPARLKSGWLAAGIGLWRFWFEFLYRVRLRFMHRILSRSHLLPWLKRSSILNAIDRSLALGVFLKHERYVLDRDVTAR